MLGNDSADKGNKAVTEKLEWAKSQRAKGLPTIPSTIGVRNLLSSFRVRGPSSAPASSSLPRLWGCRATEQ